jgi:hypothetical protein
MVARLARRDVNMPDFDSFLVEKQAPEVQFEAAVYELLCLTKALTNRSRSTSSGYQASTSYTFPFLRISHYYNQLFIIYYLPSIP